MITIESRLTGKKQRVTEAELASLKKNVDVFKRFKVLKTAEKPAEVKKEETIKPK